MTTHNFIPGQPDIKYGNCVDHLAVCYEGWIPSLAMFARHILAYMRDKLPPGDYIIVPPPIYPMLGGHHSCFCDNLRCRVMIQEVKFNPCQHTVTLDILVYKPPTPPTILEGQSTNAEEQVPNTDED
jgi:hypothetical protein